MQKLLLTTLSKTYNTFSCLGMSYEKYMDRIIVNLIENQDKTPSHTMDKVSPRDNSVVSNSVDSVDTSVKNYHISLHTDPLPQFRETYDDPNNTQHLVDFNDPTQIKRTVSYLCKKLGSNSLAQIRTSAAMIQWNK